MDKNAQELDIQLYFIICVFVTDYRNKSCANNSSLSSFALVSWRFRHIVNRLTHQRRIPPKIAAMLYVHSGEGYLLTLDLAGLISLPTPELCVFHQFNRAGKVTDLFPILGKFNEMIYKINKHLRMSEIEVNVDNIIARSSTMLFFDEIRLISNVLCPYGNSNDHNMYWTHKKKERTFIIDIDDEDEESIEDNVHIILQYQNTNRGNSHHFDCSILHSEFVKNTIVHYGSTLGLVNMDPILESIKDELYEICGKLSDGELYLVKIYTLTLDFNLRNIDITDDYLATKSLKSYEKKNAKRNAKK